MQFHGSDYDKTRDVKRLTVQIEVIFNLMADEKFRTLRDIALLTDYPEASISAQLRNMRKESFGSHTVKKRHVKNGLYEYSLIINK